MARRLWECSDSHGTAQPFKQFSGCKETPLRIISKNNQTLQKGEGWRLLTNFPNPLANEMSSFHNMFKDILGEKISTEIVEYLDKTTNEPVVLLFPNGIYAFDKFGENYLSHLNHASRRDLNQRIKLREQLFETFSRELDKKLATQEALLENCK